MNNMLDKLWTRAKRYPRRALWTVAFTILWIGVTFGTLAPFVVQCIMTAIYLVAFSVINLTDWENF